MDHYHKRSNIEATNVAIKRKFDETLKSKNPVAQVNELLAKCGSMIPVNWARFVSNENDEVKKDVSTEEPVSYKSDANISEDVILCGIMEISANMLPDEPHKYYRSH
jgi:hypothetical protein